MAGCLIEIIVELLVDHVENLEVDDEHEDERRQHTAEKVEIDHVLHADNFLELAGDHVGSLRVVGLVEFPQVVPAEHGNQANDEGQQPANNYRCPSSPRCHHSLVAKDQDRE